MVVLNENDRAYYESIGMLERNMKIYEQERIKLGLPDNCTLEELIEARNAAAANKVDNKIEMIARKSEIDFARKVLQIPSTVTDEEIDRMLNVRMERLAAINGPINEENSQIDYREETEIRHTR